MVKIVGICGPMRSGKTTVANLFNKNLNNAHSISFALAVRNQVARGMNIKTSELGSFDKNVIRPVLQAWGHGMRTLFGSDYWVTTLAQDPFWSFIDNDSVVFIDDVRYLNEIEWILHNGGCVIKLWCDVDTRINRGASPDPELLNHESETSLDGFNSYLKEIDTSLMLPHELYAEVHEVLTNAEVI